MEHLNFYLATAGIIPIVMIAFMAETGFFRGRDIQSLKKLENRVDINTSLPTFVVLFVGEVAALKALWTGHSREIYFFAIASSLMLAFYKMVIVSGLTTAMREKAAVDNRNKLSGVEEAIITLANLLNYIAVFVVTVISLVG